MGIDFATLDERAELRRRLFQQEVTRLDAESALSPAQQGVREFLQATRLADANEQPSSVAVELRKFRLGALDADQQADDRHAEMRRKAALLTFTREAPEELRETALRAGSRAAVGALDTTLRWLDTPRRLTFEHALMPLLRQAGMDLPTDADPSGREIIRRALVGEAADRWIEEWSRERGIPPVVTSFFTTGVPGFALDVIFDPLMYVTVGVGGLLRVGGRALAPAGQRLLAAARAPRTFTRAAALRPYGRLLEPVVEQKYARLATATGRRAQVLEDELALTQSAMEKAILSRPGGFQHFTEPELDAMFANLRSTTAAADIFKPGGAQFRLPYIGSMRIPILNREEQFSVAIGGHEVSKTAMRALDGLRRTAIDLGEAALATVPAPALRAAGAAGGGVAGFAAGGLLGGLAGAIGGAVPDKLLAGLRHVFVPYSYLVGLGERALIEPLKQLHLMPRVQQETVSAAMERRFSELTPEARTKTQYLLDIGAVELQRDVTGGIVRDARGQALFATETFADLATRLTALRPSGRPISPGEIEKRLRAQKRALRQTQTTLANYPSDVIPIEGVTLPDTYRPGQLAPPGTISSVPTQIIQWQIGAIDRAIRAGRLPRRLSTQQLVADDLAGLRTFKDIEPDDNLRHFIAELIRLETNVHGEPTLKGPVGAIMQYALEFGQDTLLLNYLRHIRKPMAPGVARRSRELPPQLGIRPPSNIGRRRTETFLAEPELLQATGYLTDPEVVIAKTLAQYRTMSREAQFVQLMLENYGRPHRAGSKLSDDEVLFNPREWFTRALPRGEELTSRLQYFRESGSLTDDEANALLNIVAGKQAAKGRGRDDYWIIPRAVGRGLQENRRMVQEAGGFLAHFDAILGILRTHATSVWPAYHTRNVMGNTILSHMGGVPIYDFDSWMDAIAVVKGTSDPAISARILGLVQKGSPEIGLRLRGERLDPGQDVIAWLRPYLEERGVLRTGQTAIDASVNLRAENTASIWLDKYGNNRFFRWGRSKAEYADNLAHVRHVFGRLRKGDSLEESVLSAKKYLMDYTDLTPVEREVFRRSAFFYCLPDTAEALTRAGWRSAGDVRVGDDILTYNIQAGRTEWKPALGVAVFDYDDELLRHKGRSLDLLGTPNHRWVVQDYKGHTVLKAADQINTGDHFVLTAPLVDQPDDAIDDDVLALIGWIVTDGSLSQGAYRIYQSPKKYADDVRALCGGGATEYIHPQSGVIQFYIRQPLKERIRTHLRGFDDLLPLILKLSARQRLILRDAMFKAEGCVSERPKKGVSYHFAQENAIVREAFQTLCFLDGIPMWANRRGGYLRTHRGPVKYVPPTAERYQGRVWCPSTANNTWVARDRGRVFITGNTWTRKNLALQLEMLVSEPRHAQYWNHAFQTFNNPEAQRNAEASLLPAYIREQLGLVMGQDEDGRLRFLSSLGLPLEDINLLSARSSSELVLNLLGQGNPLVQWMLNSAGLPSAFTNRAIDDDTLQNYYRQVAPIYAKIVQLSPGLAGLVKLQERTVLDARGQEQKVYSMDPWTLYALYNVLGMGRAMRTVAQAAEATEEPTLRGAGTFALRFLSGVRAARVDITRPVEALATSVESQRVDRVAFDRLDQLARNLRTDKITADQWRDQRSEVLAERQHRRNELLDQQLQKSARAIPAAEQQAVGAFRRTFAVRGQQLLDLIFSLSPGGPNPLTNTAEPWRGDPFRTTREFAETRQSLLLRLEEEFPEQFGRFEQLQERWIASLPADAQRVEREYRRAVDLLDKYEEVPKYRNLDDAQARIVDDARERQRVLSRARGPAEARRRVRDWNLDAYRLAQRAVPNRRARQQAWRELNSAHGNVLNRYFGDVPAEELAEFA